MDYLTRLSKFNNVGTGFNKNGGDFKDLLSKSPGIAPVKQELAKRNDDQASQFSRAIESIREGGGAALSEKKASITDSIHTFMKNSPYYTKEITGKGHATL